VVPETLGTIVMVIEKDDRILSNAKVIALWPAAGSVDTRLS